MDGRSPHPKTIAVVKQHLEYQQQSSSAHPVAVQPKPKKLRHRRIASGSGTHSYLLANSGVAAAVAGAVGASTSQRSSPMRDRRYQSEPEVARTVVHMVNTETQTDRTSMHMDMSETDASPSPFVASRELAMCLRDSGRGRSIEDLNAATAGDAALPVTVGKYQPQPQHAQQQRRSSTAAHPPTAVGSPNGNHSDELTYQDACSDGSDRDPLDAEDVMNSNERLDTRTPVDDDNLERLGRRVSAFFTENRHSIQSAASSDNGNNGPTAGETGANDAVAAALQTSFVDGVAATGAKVRRGFVSVSGDGSEVTVLRCGDASRESDDMCGNDSWTDEEGEDPDNQYLGLRRKR